MVLDSEQAYNEADLDRHLMGIRNIPLEKKKNFKPKQLPSILPTKIKGGKLSKEDEN